MNIRNILLSGVLAVSFLLSGCASRVYVRGYVPGPPHRRSNWESPHRERTDHDWRRVEGHWH